MAGDWIKMRGNLWDDPRVARLCDMTDQSEAAIVGALYWLWATADQHTEDGVMPGLSLRQIDRKTGVDGFGKALCDIGWLADHPEGVRIVGFEEHNGSSAKRRCSESRRKMSARDADIVRTDGGHAADETQQTCAPREEKRREEKRREEEEPIQQHTLSSTAAGGVCLAMKREGIPDPNPGHPDLLMLIEAGATEDEFRFAARTAAERGKGFTYAIGALKRQRADAAAAAAQMHRGAMPQPTKPLTAGEQRMLEACPSLVSESVRQRAAATTRPTNTTEVVDVETSPPA